MPCSKGMRGCRSDCAHRRFVLDYHNTAREQELRAEAATGGNTTELASYFGSDGESDAVEDRWTFQRHLRAYAGADYPYPDPNRRTRVQLTQAELSQWARQRVADIPRITKTYQRQAMAADKVVQDKGCDCNPTFTITETSNGPSFSNVQVTHDLTCPNQ